MLQEVASVLGDQFAGAWLDESTGRHVGFAGAGAVEGARRDARLAALAKNPRVSFVERKFSSRDLDQAIERVAQRLNARLASGSSPVSGSPSWPFFAWVNTQDNVVEVQIDAAYTSSSSDVERDLGSDLAARLVRVR